MKSFLLRGLIGALIGLLLTAVFLVLKPVPRDETGSKGQGKTSGPGTTNGDGSGGSSSTSEGGYLTEPEQIMATIVAQQLQTGPLDVSATIDKLKKLPSREKVLLAAIRILAGEPLQPKRPGVQSTGDEEPSKPKPSKQPPPKARLDLWVKVAELIDSPTRKAAALVSIAGMQRRSGDDASSNATLVMAQKILEQELAARPFSVTDSRLINAIRRDLQAPRDSLRRDDIKDQHDTKDQQWWLVWGSIIGFCASSISKPTLESMGVALKDWGAKILVEMKKSADEQQRIEDEKAGIVPAPPTPEAPKAPPVSTGEGPSGS
jgi:hypothetical protein